MNGLPRREIRTARLTLQPTSVEDAARFHAIKSNWAVTRMLRMAPFPSTLEIERAWLATHRAEWMSGRAYRFAARCDGQVIGCADLDEIGEVTGELGYWFDEAYWGRGLAGEAATALRDFAFDEIGLSILVSGHAADNPASGRVLRKLGFRLSGSGIGWSLSRKAEIAVLRYELLAEGVR